MIRLVAAHRAGDAELVADVIEIAPGAPPRDRRSSKPAVSCSGVAAHLARGRVTCRSTPQKVALEVDDAAGIERLAASVACGIAWNCVVARWPA